VQTRLRLLHTVHADFARVLPDVRATRRTGLALLVTGLLWAKTVRLPRMAAELHLLGATVPSIERRLRRWLANDAVDPAALWSPLLADLLPQLAGAAPTLVLDPTDLPGGHRLLVLGLAVRRRILPLAWAWVSSHEPWPERLGELVAGMASAVNAALPPAVIPTLLADAGLSGPRLLHACVEAGWHYLLRLPLNHNSRHQVRGPGGPEGRLWDLVTVPGQRWHGEVEIFKGAGWLPVQLTIHWEPGEPDPWILISDHVAGGTAVGRDRHRSHIEATFQDAKSRVWDLPQSKLATRDRLARLVVALVLAVWWTALLAVRAIHQGGLHADDRRDRCTRGLFRLGLRVFADRCLTSRPPTTPCQHLALSPCVEQTVRQ
jgi:hypothetical protein